MILQSLVNLYEALIEEGKVDKLGWAKTKISYGLVIDENGTLKNVVSLKTTDKSGKKEIASSLSMPMAVKRSVNIAGNFLWDTSSYIFGCDRKGKPERNKQCFEASKILHTELLSNNDSVASKSIMLYFENLDADNIENYLTEIGCTENIITDIFKNGANLVFMPLGKIASDYEDIRKCWDDHYNKSNAESGLCLVTGEKMPIAILHPSIKGVRGGQSMGTSLISFNAPAFESFEKTQGMNSPVSEYATFAYTTALNYLLSDSRYVNYFGDTTVVCWAQDNNEGCQDIFNKAFGDSDNEISQDDLWNVIHRLSHGESVCWKDIPIDPDNKFYILGLSPNAARLSVRFFLENSFGNFMKNILKHDEEMSIITPKFITNNHFPLWKILKETVNQNSKNKSAKPQLAGSFVYSILTGYKYPATLYNNIMIRIKAERDVNAEREAVRASVIKAYLTRNYPIYKEALTMELNKDCKNQAYVLGELFALLEEIQTMANPDIKTTIKDKYFTSASSIPASIFPFLIDLSQKHLRKIKSDKAGYSYVKQKEIAELYAKIDKNLPARMTMQEKGIFQIGYYHYRQSKFTKQEEK
ncbi:MAG: type I-C CRISPR-associated protein Cas8c/Csd1 [Ruminococcus sp.]|nr:type I-C CRISPR-associated protein Cas8c/Csd1 [Ruminococcus sp.]